MAKEDGGQDATAPGGGGGGGAPPGQQPGGQQQQQRVLGELDQLQERVLESVQVASRAVQALSELEELDEEAVQQQYEQYLAIMKEVHEGLASRASWIKNYVPYNRSTAGLREEVRALELRLALLKEEAAQLGHRSVEEEDEGNGAEGRGTAMET